MPISTPCRQVINDVVAAVVVTAVDEVVAVDLIVKPFDTKRALRITVSSTILHTCLIPREAMHSAILKHG